MLNQSILNFTFLRDDKTFYPINSCITVFYSELAKIYEKIESTTKRLEMTDYLVELFRKTPKEITDKVVYLTQGRLYPDFVGIELGLAEKLCISAISFTSGVKEEEIDKSWKKTGDLGRTAEEFIAKKKQQTLFSSPLTIEKVYSNFEGIAKASGRGSQELKIKLLAELLHDSIPTEAKYIIRTITGKLRLGIADMTILDALVVAFVEKEEKVRSLTELEENEKELRIKGREEIERAYNISSDLGRLAKKVADKGIIGANEVKITLGIPIKMMLCERLNSIEEIFEKLGKCAFDYKYDGLRIQAHIGKKIKLFSRNLEEVSKQFPDVIDVVMHSFKEREGIIEGECVPINIETGELLPFQEVSHRRGRKYGLENAREEFPVVLFLFDCLYINGEDLTNKSYLERRKKLEESIIETDKVKLSKLIISENKEEVEKFFEESLSFGCEGLIAKNIKEDSFYKPGKRGWNWIKYKREYKSEMVDTVDLTIVGAFAGRGRRSGKYGALLMAVYNSQKDEFETICKLGTGFTDEFLDELPKLLEKHKIDKKDKRVNSEIKADIWFMPKVVFEVLGAEITHSPIHTCGYGILKENVGLAIRFPRFTGKIREEKNAEQSTTTEEVIKIYKLQLKKIE